jgi:hypothetical protein
MVMIRHTEAAPTSPANADGAAIEYQTKPPFLDDPKWQPRRRGARCAIHQWGQVRIEIAGGLLGDAVELWRCGGWRA